MEEDTSEKTEEKRGKFITFEGIDGCGKSTQAKLLAEKLMAAGKRVVLTREPGGTPLAERVREALLSQESKPSSQAELLLFLAARAQSVADVVEPALESGAWVVCDRFSDSTFAYQGYGRGMDVATLEKLDAFATSGLKPDLTILLDLDREASKSRIAIREEAAKSEADRIEQAGEAFHERVREGFLKLAKRDFSRIATIEASQSVEEVAADVWIHVQRMGL